MDKNSGLRWLTIFVAGILAALVVSCAQLSFGSEGPKLSASYQDTPPVTTDPGGWSGAGIYSFSGNSFAAVVMHPITRIVEPFGWKRVNLWVDGFGGATVGSKSLGVAGGLLDIKGSIAKNVFATFGIGAMFSSQKPSLVIGGGLQVTFVTK